MRNMFKTEPIKFVKHKLDTTEDVLQVLRRLVESSGFKEIKFLSPICFYCVDDFGFQLKANNGKVIMVATGVSGDWKEMQEKSNRINYLISIAKFLEEVMTQAIERKLV